METYIVPRRDGKPARWWQSYCSISLQHLARYPSLIAFPRVLRPLACIAASILRSRISRSCLPLPIRVMTSLHLAIDSHVATGKWTINFQLLSAYYQLLAQARFIISQLDHRIICKKYETKYNSMYKAWAKILVR